MKQILFIKRLTVCIVALILYNTTMAKTIRYVTVNGTGDGSSWNNASNSIQSMIDNSTSGDEVWVAKGTYYPTTETIARDPRSKTITTKSGVNMFGGFAGTETEITQRTLSDLDLNGRVESYELLNTTLISGDIDGVKDVWTKTINTDGTWKWTVSGNSGNCYHVVTANSQLDGFSIIGGNTNGDSNSYGGGIYSFSSVANCTVYSCTATYGGGIYSSYSAINCNVSNCLATDGGGIYSRSSITNCTVSNCSANNGGGICNNFNSVINCSVFNCSAINGGGVYSNVGDINSNYSVINSKVYNCSATKGGGIYSFSSATNCSVYNCFAIDGGGIYTISATNCTVYNCSATTGGGINVIDIATNCTVYNCSATNGGGIWANSATNCNVYNCSASNGGGIYYSYSIDNCAFSNNSTNGAIGSGIRSQYGKQTNCIFPSISSAYINPTSFIGVATTAAQKLELINANSHLLKGSPCINAGIHYGLSTTILTGKDFDNNPRILYGIIDVGAFEFLMPTIPMPAIENFNNWTDFDKSDMFYRSAYLSYQNDVKWIIVNQKAVFSWQTNLTTNYGQPIFTYQIDATKSSKVYLRYDMYFQAYGGTISPLGTEKLNVEFSTDLVTWSNIATYSNANGTIANQNYKHDISTLAAGKTFFIRFNANGVNSNRIEKWEIDNVAIDADGTSAINSVQEDKYKYSISNGVLSITNLGQVATIQLFDVNGKILANKVESQIVNLTLPAHGVYIIKVASDSGFENKKVVW